MADLATLDAQGQALGRLAAQDAAATNLRNLVAGFASRFQDLDDVARAVQTARSVTTGTGVHLDQIGVLVGQPRAGGDYPVGEADADYRRKLAAAVLRNRSRGTGPDMIAVMLALLGAKALKVQIADFPPAAFALAIQTTAALTAAEKADVIAFAQASRGAGIKIVGIASYTDPTFAFDGFPDPPFAGYDDGTGNVGGFWADYFFP